MTNLDWFENLNNAESVMNDINSIRDRSKFIPNLLESLITPKGRMHLLLFIK